MVNHGSKCAVILPCSLLPVIHFLSHPDSRLTRYSYFLSHVSSNMSAAGSLEEASFSPPLPSLPALFPQVC